jgi:hypothetical protein
MQLLTAVHRSNKGGPEIQIETVFVQCLLMVADINFPLTYIHALRVIPEMRLVARTKIFGWSLGI